MAQNFLSGTSPTAIDTRRILLVKILNSLNGGGGGGGGSGTGQAGIVGVGSPEGVQTATAGTSYLDSSTGAYWYKQTGSGNTGWTQITGPF
jgi:hypothetical protein